MNDNGRPITITSGSWVPVLNEVGYEFLVFCSGVADTRTTKRILDWKPIGTRIKGRLRKRWIVDIEEDLQNVGIRWCRKQCKERAEWKRITEKAKTFSGL
jgi:hypothetical protein